MDFRLGYALDGVCSWVSSWLLGFKHCTLQLPGMISQPRISENSAETWRRNDFLVLKNLPVEADGKNI